MSARSLRAVPIVLALSVPCLLGVLLACAHPTQDAYVREVIKGEMVPVEGPHQHFEVPEQPTPIRVEGDRFQLAFVLPDGRTRHVVFLVHREGSLLEVSCPLTNLEPDADALLSDDRRLNEAISGHTPVRVAAHEWTTFFNDRLSGVFSSDWQLWWGESPPDE